MISANVIHSAAKNIVLPTASSLLPTIHPSISRQTPYMEHLHCVQLVLLHLTSMTQQPLFHSCPDIGRITVLSFQFSVSSKSKIFHVTVLLVCSTEQGMRASLFPAVQT